jgi:hypothetical protein
VTVSDDAAVRRANYVQGLQAERAMYAAAGRADRVKQVDAEIARVTGKPKGRTAAKRETAEG